LTQMREIEKSAKELRKLVYVAAFFFLAISLGLALFFDVNPWLAFLIAAVLVLPYVYYKVTNWIGSSKNTRYPQLKQKEFIIS